MVSEVLTESNFRSRIGSQRFGISLLH